MLRVCSHQIKTKGRQEKTSGQDHGNAPDAGQDMFAVAETVGDTD